MLAVDQQESRHVRFALPEAGEFVVGRESTCDGVIVWEAHLSRRHFRAVVGNEGIVVTRLPQARNPIFYRGEEVETFELTAGEAFVIGSTTFRLLAGRREFSSPSNENFQEYTFSREELDLISFSDAEKRIEILTHLPDLISNSQSEEEIFQRLGTILLTGMINVDSIAIVGIVDETVEVFYSVRKYDAAGEVRPSRKLVVDALETQHQTVMHLWSFDHDEQQSYTMAQGADWAVCTPLQAGHRRWGIYCSGKTPDPVIVEKSPQLTPVNRVNADIKFVELVSEIVGSILRLRTLERQQAGLRQFFSPPILQALGEQFDTNLLEPRECDVVVMFCDLRDFSRRAEQKSGDLFGILNQVSLALEIVTSQILKHGGVIGDFHGDAALGFWGWPISSTDVGLNACRAALAIREAFETLKSNPELQLAITRVGIGLAYGRAVAGKIGTSDQVKVTVFGPVVNLASRLESCTKTLRVPVVIEESLVRLVEKRLTAREGRLRKLARIIPFGLKTPYDVYELLPPHSHLCPLTDEQVRTYEDGINHFIAGDWEVAYRHLHAMPSSDHAMDFIIQRIVEHDRSAPLDWDGIIRMQSK